MDKRIHEPARLRIMAHLYHHRDSSFVTLRAATGLTDGNLAAHAKTLESEGLIEGRRALAGTRFELRYQITKNGVAAFRQYLADLRAVLDDSRA